MLFKAGSLLLKDWAAFYVYVILSSQSSLGCFPLKNYLETVLNDSFVALKFLMVYII
jgi:hypothetical protein